MSKEILLGAFLAALTVTSCSGQQSDDPRPVFPEAEAPTQFTRAYSLTESADGQVRVFAKEDGDETWLYEVRREGKSWSKPQRMELPARKMLTGPSFSAADGALYYASDEELPEMPGRKDLNLWYVPLEDGVWGTPKPVPGDVNTGANETMAAISANGLMVFVSNHSQLGGGGYEMAEARQDQNGNWVMQRPLDELNDIRTNDHVALTADGKRLFFYSHRSPKLGVVDIWTSQKLDDGSWGEPVNPGEPLNTSGIDFGAGLSADGETLFFSRDGALYEMPFKALHLTQP
ncbi:MAG: hypothetical protein GYB49_09205 [Alphaproteobacteria bacterium]|nr:hypothetical protein [Hyphomonas sp.]MBR9807386.1 hypothetical protein [Alphaproteobacteria bacterium]|tara:strand:+ start:12865 stop:13731 length:867 start_codon:yes stop_codon:yes gene_type:complete